MHTYARFMIQNSAILDHKGRLDHINVPFKKHEYKPQKKLWLPKNPLVAPKIFSTISGEVANKNNIQMHYNVFCQDTETLLFAGLLSGCDELPTSNLKACSSCHQNHFDVIDPTQTCRKNDAMGSSFSVISQKMGGSETDIEAVDSEDEEIAILEKETMMQQQHINELNEKTKKILDNKLKEREEIRMLQEMNRQKMIQVVECKRREMVNAVLVSISLKNEKIRRHNAWAETPD